MLHVEKEEEDDQNGKTLWELDDGETESMESVTFVQVSSVGVPRMR